MQKNKNKELNIILDLVVQGKTNKDIATVLNFSVPYVKKLLSRLFKKYKVENRTALAIEYMAQRIAEM